MTETERLGPLEVVGRMVLAGGAPRSGRTSVSAASDPEAASDAVDAFDYRHREAAVGRG